MCKIFLKQSFKSLGRLCTTFTEKKNCLFTIIVEQKSNYSACLSVQPVINNESQMNGLVDAAVESKRNCNIIVERKSVPVKYSDVEWNAPDSSTDEGDFLTESVTSDLRRNFQ